VKASVLRLEHIRIYPVKSCRGISVERADVVETGLAHDRMWMVIDENGEFVTQREQAGLARVETAIEDERLWLSVPGLGSVAVPLRPDGGPVRPARVWGHPVPAHDAGDEAAALLGTHLRMGCRLVRMPDDHERPVGAAYRGRARTAFTDGYPLLVLSTASLEALNERLSEPVSIDRFRPNLVVGGGTPHVEDAWTTVRIGEVELVACKPCPRCVVTTIDPQSGARGKEPLRTLARYRTREGGVMFGQNLVHLGRGTLRVGDAVVAASD